MPPRNATPPAASDEIAQIRDEVTDLKNQVRVLSDILDEIRQELQWVSRNGLPIQEPLPACPTLKRMALDPCAVDWSERLVIEFGGTAPAKPVQSSARSDYSTSALSEVAIARGGEQRQLF